MGGEAVNRSMRYSTAVYYYVPLPTPHYLLPTLYYCDSLLRLIVATTATTTTTITTATHNNDIHNSSIHTYT